MANTQHRQHRRDVAARLQLTLEALDLKQAEVAETLGVSLSKLGNWLRGDTYPNEFLMTLFCDRYGVTMDWLYRGQIYGLPGALADGLARARRGTPAPPPAPSRQVRGRT